MFTVLIVEDELLVRIGLKSSINWDKMGMKVIADVPNGQAAMEVYEREKPDIVLTDIKMPVMDGIQLISKIREENAKTKIVVLTCYEEFETIHKAVNLGVSGYILKLKMSTNEMETLLSKIQEELIKENAKSLDKKDVSLDPGIVKGNLIKNYMFYHLYDEFEFTNSVKAKQMRLTPDRLIICRMTIDDFELLQNKFKDDHGDLIHFAVINIVDELLLGYKRGEVIHEKDENYLIILSFQDIVSEKKIFEILHEILGRIREVMKTYINTSVSFGISRIHSSYPELKEMYKECLIALEQRYFIGAGGVIRYDDAVATNYTEYAINKLKKFVNETNLIYSEYCKEVEADIDSLIKAPSLSKVQLQKSFLKWIYWPTTNVNISKEGIYRIAVDYAGQVNKCISLDENIAGFKNFLSELAEYGEKSRCLSKEIAEVVQFVQKNYQKDISLQQAAELVQISTNYLSSLFKKELQLGFVEYVNQVRIEKAKDMLLNTYQRTYEIAQNVGFADESYFSRTFKKLTGLRPNEFRKQRVANLQEVNCAREV